MPGSEHRFEIPAGIFSAAVEGKTRFRQNIMKTDKRKGLHFASACAMISKSVKKKFKDKSFAFGVNRDVVRSGCEMLGMELDEVIRETIEGMKEKAAEIGLKGNL